MNNYISPDNNYRHRLPLQIRFNDIDALGHVNNSVYFQFFDLGKSNYFETAAKESIDWKKANIVVANVNCNFIAPTLHREPIAVDTRVEWIGRSSFGLRQRIINVENGSTKAECVTIMVGFNVETQSSEPISEEWIATLNSYENRELRKSMQPNK